MKKDKYSTQQENPNMNMHKDWVFVITSQTRKHIAIAAAAVGVTLLSIFMQQTIGDNYELRNENDYLNQQVKQQKTVINASQQDCNCREYQIELEMDHADIYDGDRFVGTLPFNSRSAFDKLMMKDNE